jgi:hypothetical protein
VTLPIHIEVQPSPTVNAHGRKSEKTKRNVGRRNKSRIRKGPISRSDVTIGREEFDPGVRCVRTLNVEYIDCPSRLRKR